MAAAGKVVPIGIGHVKLAVLFAMLALCAGLISFFHLSLYEETVYTHLFYIPIGLAAIWWGSKAIYVSVLLSAMLIGAHAFSDAPTTVSDDILRSGMFILAGVVLAFAIERMHANQRLATEEHEENMRRMGEHFDYVRRVSHELRNPLQITMGAIDSLETTGLNDEQREMVHMIERGTDRIRVEIEELTAREA